MYFVTNDDQSRWKKLTGSARAHTGPIPQNDQRLWRLYEPLEQK